MNRLLIVALSTVVLTGCQFVSLRPAGRPIDGMVAQNDWVAAVRYYREALKRDPNDAESVRGYRATSDGAVMHYVEQARSYVEVEDFASAEAAISQGLIAVPESADLRRELGIVAEMRKSRLLYNDALAAIRLGRHAIALDKLKQALRLDPNYAAAGELYNRAGRNAAIGKEVEPIRLATGAPVTVNFNAAPFKQAVLALGETYGINVIFDAAVEDQPISLRAENIEFGQAFNLVLKTNGTFYRRIGVNSVIVVPDTPEGRAKYEDYLVRTFYLTSTLPAEMASLLTTSLGMQNVSVSETGKSLTVRDTREKIALAAQLIAVNDRAPAEVVLAVEILEVNRTKSEQLGIDFGSQISIGAPDLTLGDFTSRKALGTAIGASAVSLPSITLRYFKQDVDAKTLANPTIRTVDRQEAQIHIGDRVPLRSSTIQDATGQTRTTFNYQDIGIKLTVTPEVKPNQTVLVKLNLEVSSLGQNLGTSQEPAYAIGTRNISNQMVLEDSEVAVIGGLIRDEERDTIQKVPGLGDIPRIGRLFRSRDGQGTRTDMLLTLTPHIVRALDVPGQPEAEFLSGSGERVGLGGAVDFIGAKDEASRPAIRLDLSGGALQPASKPDPAELPTTTFNAPAAAISQETVRQRILAFSHESYALDVGGKLAVPVTAAGFDSTAAGTVTVRYRADLVAAQEVATQGGLAYRIDNERGEVQIDLDGGVAGPVAKPIATINFEGLKLGLSYLVFSNSLGAEVEPPKNLQIQASRIVVR